MQKTETDEVPGTFENLRESIHFFATWAWLILLAGLLAGVAAYLTSIRMTPIYETSMRLLISNPTVNQSLDTGSMISNGTTMTSTYAEMLVDTPVLQGVIDTLKLPMTYEELKKSITVQIVTNTQLLLVKVQDPDPVLAAKIDNTLATVFTDRIRDLQSQRYASTEKDLTQQVSDMEKQVNDTTVAIASENDPAQKLQLEARLTQYHSLYSNLVTNLEQVRLAEAQTSTNVFVSEPALVSTVPISPKTVLYTILAVLAGMLLTLGILFIIDKLDDSIKNPEDIRKRFKLPVLGTIPSDKLINGKPTCLVEPRSLVAESFRSLRTNLNFSSVDKPLKFIMVTSSTPQEGKTSISTNLAVSMAQGGKRVLLIDADLRRPQVHNKFGLKNRNGFSDLFVSPSEMEDRVLQSCEEPQLTILTSGNLPPNPAELLISKKMGQILERFGREYDLVLFDSPPLLLVTDATVLATQMDGVLVVVKPGETKSGVLEQSLEQLHSVNARVLGIVLNGVNPSSRKYGYYYNRSLYKEKS